MSGTIARTVAIAVIGLAVAAGAFGRALHNAVRLDPVVPDPAATPPIGAAPAVETAEPLTEEALRLAVQNDPFREERTAAAERYRMPGEMPAFVRAPRERPTVEPPEFTVIGTLTFADGGFAVIQMEDGSRRVISVGESHQGYRLSGVRGNTATLTRGDAEFSLKVPEPSPFPPQPRRGRNNRGRGDDDDERGRNSGRNGGRSGDEIQVQRSQELLRALQGIRGRGAGGGDLLDVRLLDFGGSVLRFGRGGGPESEVMIADTAGTAVVRILRRGGGDGGAAPRPDGSDGR